MVDIFTAKCGEKPVRFVMIGGDLFVSKDDLFSLLKECFTPKIVSFSQMIMEKALEFLTDSADRKSAIIGESSIGLVVQFHAAGNIISTLSDLTDVAQDELRETAFRVNSIYIWYAETLSKVTEHFGITFMDSIELIKKRLDRINPAFVVDVYKDGECWIAECDKLHLVTEADSYEELTRRAAEIAEDLYIENGFGDTADGLRLSFRQEQNSIELLEM